MPSQESIVQGGGNFPPPRWSVVVATLSDDSAERAGAWDVLFAAYWKPVYKYYSPELFQAARGSTGSY